MPVDFSNAQSMMYWGAVLDDSTTTSTEQPALTSEQIAEKQHQDFIGVGLFGIFLILFVGMIVLGEKNLRK